MSPFATIVTIAADYSTRRRHRRACAEMMSLPDHVRKDIGWREPLEDRVPAQRLSDL